MDKEEHKLVEQVRNTLDDVATKVSAVGNTALENKVDIAKILEGFDRLDNRITELRQHLIAHEASEEENKKTESLLNLGLVMLSMSIGLYALSFPLPKAHFAIISTLFAIAGLIAVMISTIRLRRRVHKMERNGEQVKLV